VKRQHYPDDIATRGASESLIEIEGKGEKPPPGEKKKNKRGPDHQSPWTRGNLFHKREEVPL